MREILFRGKRIDNGEWVFGRQLANDVIVPIGQPLEFEINTGFIRSDLKCYAVDPSTVGQYTGLTDKNGKKIFEGDYCRVTRHFILCYGSITFIKGSFWFDEFNTDSILELSKLEINNFEIEIIGNIHDNPELLEGDTR